MQRQAPIRILGERKHSEYTIFMDATQDVLGMTHPTISRGILSRDTPFAIHQFQASLRIAFKLSLINIFVANRHLAIEVDLFVLMEPAGINMATDATLGPYTLYALAGFGSRKYMS